MGQGRARTCISTSSGMVMPRRQPRRPNMGFTFEGGVKGDMYVYERCG